VDAAGNLYGTTTDNDSNGGTVFKMGRRNSGWIFSILHTFGVGSDGSDAYGGVVQDAGGVLYGTTCEGGSNGDGTIYRLQPAPTFPASITAPWTETILHNFTDSDRDCPDDELTQDGAGNYYGSTTYGGAYGDGSVFQLSPSGSGFNYNVIYSFSGGSDGNGPYSGVTLDSAGNLYGTTYLGGNGDSGTVYELTPNGSGWTETVFYRFSGSDGDNPAAGVILDGAGNLYGATVSGGCCDSGVVFKLAPSNGGWSYTSLHDFTGSRDGAGPFGGVTLDSSDNLYGTTNGGGSGFGVVFEISH